jgi:hypothetical protein
MGYERFQIKKILPVSQLAREVVRKTDQTFPRWFILIALHRLNLRCDGRLLFLDQDRIAQILILINKLFKKVLRCRLGFDSFAPPDVRWAGHQSGLMASSALQSFSVKPMTPMQVFGFSLAVIIRARTSSSWSPRRDRRPRDARRPLPIRLRAT